MKADKLFLGNIITMDKQRPFAEALTLMNGKITYVGDREIAEQLCDDKTEICDYTGQYIYPGFMEAHCHPGGAGYIMIGVTSLWDGETMEDYGEIMKKDIAEHPGKKYYVGGGWREVDGVPPEAKYLDEASTEVPIIIQSRDGHSMLLNHKAMEEFGIDAEYAKSMKPGEVKVYDDGEPTGYISETPASEVMSHLQGSVEDMKRFLLCWQETFISLGFTASADAGVELVSESELLALNELDKEGKLKIYTFGWSAVKDDSKTPEKDVENIALKQKKYNGDRFNILGPKIFLDGVVEGHTGWLLEEYSDVPGYYGVPRYSDMDCLVRLLRASEAKGMSVHAHTIGDAAVKTFLDAACQVQLETGNMDMRNIAVHLQIVRPEDVKRFGQYNIIPGSGLLWASNDHHEFNQEAEFVGVERRKNSYPGKSLLDAGARMVTHTDFPVSRIVQPPDFLSVLCRGYRPHGTKEDIRNPKELITRQQALEALTINVAYEFKREHDMGSLEIGKLGNMTIYDTDFLNCTDDEIGKAKQVATVIKGEICG